jgi:hypothetical protein
VTANDLVLAVGMPALLLTEIPAAERTESAARIWQMIRHGIET